MAKKNKKISITSIDKIMKENCESGIILEWHGVEIEIKKTLGLKEVLEFVNDVTLSCFHDKGGYMPEIMDLAIKSNIIKKYTNVSMPDNISHQYEILYNTDIVAAVSEHINIEQLNEITSSIGRKISYMCNTNIMEIQKQMNELVSSFATMQEKTSNLFADLTPEDIANISSAIEDGKLDEDKIVSAYLEKVRSAEKADKS